MLNLFTLIITIKLAQPTKSSKSGLTDEKIDNKNNLFTQLIENFDAFPAKDDILSAECNNEKKLKEVFVDIEKVKFCSNEFISLLGKNPNGNGGICESKTIKKLGVNKDRTLQTSFNNGFGELQYQSRFSIIPVKTETNEIEKSDCCTVQENEYVGNTVNAKSALKDLKKAESLQKITEDSISSNMHCLNTIITEINADAFCELSSDICYLNIATKPNIDKKNACKITFENVEASADESIDNNQININKLGKEDQKEIDETNIACETALISSKSILEIKETIKVAEDIDTIKKFDEKKTREYIRKQMIKQEIHFSVAGILSAFYKNKNYKMQIELDDLITNSHGKNNKEASISDPKRQEMILKCMRCQNLILQNLKVARDHGLDDQIDMLKYTETFLENTLTMLNKLLD